MTLPKGPQAASDLRATLNDRNAALRAKTARQPTGLLTPGEVALAFKVDPRTVTRWARQGRLTSIRTLGGHRRYMEAEVRALLNGSQS